MNERHLKSQEKPPDVYNITDSVHDVYTTTEVEHRPLQPPPGAHPQRGRSAHKAKPAPVRTQEPARSRQNSQDVEKGSPSHQSIHTQRSQMSPYEHTANSYTDDNEEYDEDEEDDSHEPKRHAVWILIYMSGLAPLLALPIALYTILVTILLLLLSPFCFCMKQRPLTARFHHFLSPSPRLELYLIFSIHDSGAMSNPDASSVVRVIFANIFAPIYAVAIAVAAWVVAAFWTYTAILGNPDGKEDRDDGREAVLAVRGWWERWLLQGLG